MPRPKNSSPKSYELIFNALIDGPRCYSEIIENTNLHRNTVSSRLAFLVEENLLVKHRNGRKMMYEIPLCFKEDNAWLDKWAEYLSRKDFWEKMNKKNRI